ncbi:hypothetical protein C2E31_23050 [Rhodopirellula baltica]|nr:hypothetical protein C2E31_23050 [Rhodopirellula baltica]
MNAIELIWLHVLVIGLPSVAMLICLPFFRWARRRMIRRREERRDTGFFRIAVSPPYASNV